MSHPRSITPFVYASQGKHCAVLTTDCAVDLRKGFKGQHEIDIGSGLSIRLADDILTIPKGYQSDLCSPAVMIWGIRLGTPSGQREALAAVVHDALRQVHNLRLPCLSHITRKLTDDVFFDFLREAQSPWVRVYHRAVSGIAGSIFIRLTSKPQKANCIHHP